MTVDEIKKEAYNAAVNGENTEPQDIVDRFLWIQAYAVYKLYDNLAITKADAKIMMARAVIDYNSMRLHKDMYMGKERAHPRRKCPGCGAEIYAEV